MADKILYTNKEELIDDESIPLKNKVTADDMNEIKEVINSHADDIETLDEEKADITEIPTDLSELSNENTKFVNETQLATAVNEERTARQNADNIIGNTIATISVDYGRTIELSLDSSTFILTATLKNKNGATLSSSNIDLPIESVVVNGRYDSATKKIILTLQNGNTIEIPVGDLISGLQSEITPQNKLSSDLVDDTNHTNKFVTQAEKNQIKTNKNNIINLNENKENISNKVTELTEESTDTQYPSAKAVYDNESALKEKLDRYKNTIETELGDSTDTGTDLTLNATAEFDVDLGFSGNTEQATNIKTYTCVGTETGDYYFTYNNINYQFTMPTIEVNSILAFNTDTLKLYLGETEITTTTDNTGTLITLQDTPNPEYPQTVHVVKGNNEVKIANSDNTQSQTYPITLPTGMEMCKIGDSADEFVYQNNTWYKNPKIIKEVFVGIENWLFQRKDTGRTVFKLAINNVSNNVQYLSNMFLYDDLSTLNRLSIQPIDRNIYMSLDDLILGINDTDTQAQKVQKLKTWLSTNSIIIYRIAGTPVPEEITDTTLITQLNNIKQAYTYQGQTNISQTNADLPFIIKVDFKLSNLLRIEALESALETVSSRVDLLEE